MVYEQAYPLNEVGIIFWLGFDQGCEKISRSFYMLSRSVCTAREQFEMRSVRNFGTALVSMAGLKLSSGYYISVIVHEVIRGIELPRRTTTCGIA